MHGPIYTCSWVSQLSGRHLQSSVFKELHHLGMILVEAQSVVLKRGLPGGELIVEVLDLLIICNLGSEKSDGIKC